MEGLLIHRTVAPPEVLEERRARITALSAAFSKTPQLRDFTTVQEYRDARENGTHGFPKPWFSGAAKIFEAPARDGHKIPLRAINPTNGKRGFALHYHSGGYVIGSAKLQDAYLADIARRMDMMIISVDYRMSPEHKWPIPQQDCIDAAVWALSEEGETILDAGGPLQFLTGDSAGGNAAVLVALSLRNEFKIDVRARIKALMLNYALFDVSGTPSNLRYAGSCLVSRQSLDEIFELGYADVPKEDLRKPHISPLYADLSNMPPAIFSCGDEDALLDDSIFMATRWHMSGNKTALQIIPEVYHVFNLNPTSESAIECNERIIEFAQKCL
ncbi:Carboxylesterase NlhH [Cercospora zeina]